MSTSASSWLYPRPPRRVRMRGYVILALGGLWWYSTRSPVPSSMSSLELGLSYLATVALVLFLMPCMLKGFTPARVLLLVLPFAGCVFLDFSDPARAIPRSQIGPAELRQVLLWADLYLLLMLAWIVVFPLPLAA